MTNIHSIMIASLDDYMYHDQSLQCCLSGLHWATSEAGHDGRVTSAFIVMAISEF